MEPNNSSVATAKLAGPMELLSSTWSMFKTHWKVLVTIAAIPIVLSSISQLFIIIPNFGFAFFGLILLILAVVFSISMQGALIDTVRKLTANPSEPISIKGQYKFGFSIFWSFVWILILSCFISFGSMIFLLIPTIIIGVYMLVNNYALVIDGKKGLDAFVESYSLVKNRWWKVLGRFASIVLVLSLLSLVLSGVMFVILFIFGLDKLSFTYTVIYIAIKTVFSVCISTVSFVYIYKLYSSLKATRTPNIEVIKFRKWLKFFAIFGLLGIPLFLIVSSFILVSLNSDLIKNQLQDQNAVQFQSGMVQNLENATE